MVNDHPARSVALLVGFVLIASLCTARPAAAQATADSVWNRLAATFVRHLSTGHFDSAGAMISPAVPAGALDTTRLGQIWAQLIASAGALTSLTPATVDRQDSLHIVDQAAKFERQDMTIRVVLMPDSTVGGLWFRPPAPPDWTPAAYVTPAAFDEIDLHVGVEPWILPGTLSLPRGDSLLPAVVLVHGSGPHDRDASIGPNKPFRDLAWGLASTGIAVLRYDKRTNAYAGRVPDSLTIEGEVITDALAALAALRSHPRIDTTRIFLAGHSLGAMMAPAIARRDSALAGLILLAAPARPIVDVMHDQMDYIASLPETDDVTRAGLNAMIDSLYMLHFRRLPPTQIVMGAPASYYYDLAEYNPVEALAAVPVPVMLLHGGRDYQVSSVELSEWRNALQYRANAVIREYPSLNHLFIAGTGMPTPVEYGKAGHVSDEVIREVAAWIGTLPVTR